MSYDPIGSMKKIRRNMVRFYFFLLQNIQRGPGVTGFNQNGFTQAGVSAAFYIFGAVSHHYG